MMLHAVKMFWGSGISITAYLWQAALGSPSCHFFCQGKCVYLG